MDAPLRRVRLRARVRPHGACALATVLREAAGKVAVVTLNRALALSLLLVAAGFVALLAPDRWAR